MFWQVEAINISMIDLRIVFRLYCFFQKVCPYTHFHFKCRSAMLICINFNRSHHEPAQLPAPSQVQAPTPPSSRLLDLSTRKNGSKICSLKCFINSIPSIRNCQDNFILLSFADTVTVPSTRLYLIAFSTKII